MAISIDWPTRVITIPQSYLSASGSNYSLNTTQLHSDLRDLEDDEQGIVYPATHNYVAPITVGGVDLAPVIEIINGYTITFENGSYRVILNGSNNNILDVANLNSVSIAPTNSAGLTYSKQVEDSAFTDARVWIDTINGQAGTQYPIGTSSVPVNNFADAKSIITTRSLPKRIHLRGDITIGAEDISDYDFQGASASQASITFTNTTTTRAVLDAINVSGSVVGQITVKNSSSVNALTGFSGELINSGLAGVTTLAGYGSPSAGFLHEVINCHSDTPGSTTPVLDCNSISGLNLSIRNYSGGLELRNYVDGGSVTSIDLASGHVVLTSSCTSGTVVIRGVGHVTDNSGAGCTVITAGLVDPDDAQLTTIEGLLTTLTKYSTNRTRIDATAKTLTVYDDDDITPIRVFDLKDSAGTASVDEVYERVPQ